MADMPEDEFSVYVDMLFLGRLVCSRYGAEFSPGSGPKRDDGDWAVATARDAIDKGWRLDNSRGRKAFCPACTTPTLKPGTPA